MIDSITKIPVDHRYFEMDLLRLITCGSVDDGKSTLIGRLFYDSKSIFEDQWDAIEKHSKKSGDEHVNLALLTDGLRAEREQGITIDVAYRYFATPKRKFIIADTPGHVQYTRNMVTGASTADLAILLVDARKGILEQTRRHACIASLLQIKHVILCVNKMDLVDYRQDTFEKIVNDFENFASKLSIPDITYIPINALGGNNVVEKTKHMPWYQGASLLHTLEHIHISSDVNHTDARFPVQWVIRPQSKEYPDFRGYGGRIEAGVYRPGDTVIHLPSGFTSTIASIEMMGSPIEIAFPPMSVTIVLKDTLDISRGDMLIKEENPPTTGQDFDIMICWLHENPLKQGGKYILKHGTKEVRCLIKEIKHKVDIQTLDPWTEDKDIRLNDIGRIRLRCTQPLFFDSYTRNRKTGSVILIDEFTFDTVGAGMIL
jgi:sulfate adenylyltransferase subunit 1